MKHRTLLLLIAYVGFVSLGLPDGVIGVAWPSVRETFHRQQDNLGLIYIASSCGYFISSIYTGALLRMMTVGVLLAATSGLVAMSAFGFSLAPVWMLFVGCAVLHGLGSGAIDSGLNNFIAHNFSARHMNWLHACYSLGATLGPLLMTSMLAWTGRWRLGYVSIGVLMAALATVFLLTRRTWAADPTTTEQAPAPVSATMRETLRLRVVWFQVAIFFLYTGLEVMVGAWCFTVLTESRGMRTETAGLITTCYWASIGVGRVLFGFVVEKIGVERLLRGATLLAVTGTVIFAAAPSFFSIVGLALIGLALAPIYPCLMTQTPERVGEAYAPHAIGFQVSAAMIGAAALPALAGVLGQFTSLEFIPLFAVVLAIALLSLHELVVKAH